MQFKLTSRFLLVVLAVFGVVFIVNSMIFLFLLFQQNREAFETISASTVQQLTRQLDDELIVDGQTLSFPNETLQQLERHNAWLQVVDFSGNVVYGYNVPSDVLTEYRPVDFVQSYRYQEQVHTTTFFGDGEQYNYIVGVVDGNLERVVLTYENDTVLSVIQKLLLILTIINLCIIIVAGWLFSRPLTKPIARIIDSIQLLETKQPLRPIKRVGLYAPVFKNLQNVSENLSKAEEERIRLEKMREEWISNVSHDLKTPLASIRGYAELMDTYSLNDDERLEYTKTIERQAEHMKNLLDDFNLTMRLRNQQLPMSLERVNFVSFVREIVIDLLNNPTAQPNIEFDTHDEMVMKSIDVHYMRRALLNFISNAITHNRDDVVIHITINKAGALRIEDNGKGIPAADIDHIFERYYRGTNTATTDGTGLGMAIARDIIVAHGGNVTLTSTEHVGTAVTIELPAVQ